MHIYRILYTNIQLRIETVAHRPENTEPGMETMNGKKEIQINSDYRIITAVF